MCLPRHRVSVPLHRPDDRHSLTVEPTSIKPASHVKMAVAPKVVCVPIFCPLAGVGRSPQEITLKGGRKLHGKRPGLKEEGLQRLHQVAINLLRKLTAIHTRAVL